MKSEYLSQTLEYIKVAKINYRKELGQYFTPRSVRDILFSHIPKKNKKLLILDPACGTGEFLVSAREYFPLANVEGWDVDRNMIKISRITSPQSNLIVKNALDERVIPKYDLIIGNPPYYEFSPSKEIKRKFGNIMNGRPNIFSLFIKLGLDLLKENGYLAYVVPPSMNNGAYFSKIRDYIVQNSNIEFLKILKNTSIFHDALQMTMLLILKKGENRGDHVFKHNGIMIFCEDAEYLSKSFLGTCSIRDLGYSVRTGRIVWNQNKNKLTDNPNEGIPLLWAHNISDSGLRFPVISKKPQYIRSDSFDIGPAILVNRITGASKTARIRAAIVPDKMKFIAENHCNVIFPSSIKDQMSLIPSSHIKAISLENLCSQLRSPEKLEVMRNITGNTQISKTELERLFPIT